MPESCAADALEAKHFALARLAKRRQSTRWDGYGCLADYHGGAYECELVSPYSKTAGAVDSDVMVLLQDWASDDFLRKPLDPQLVVHGLKPGLPTNENLTDLLGATAGLRLSDVYGTNLFPFIKPGDMGTRIPARVLTRAALEFALPQIELIVPRVVICIGKDTFNGLRSACGLRTVKSLTAAFQAPFNFGAARIYAQGHCGARGRNTRNRGGVDQMLEDWKAMTASWMELSA